MLLNVSYQMTRFQFDLVYNCSKRELFLSTRHNGSYWLDYLLTYANAHDLRDKLFKTYWYIFLVWVEKLKRKALFPWQVKSDKSLSLCTTIFPLMDLEARSLWNAFSKTIKIYSIIEHVRNQKSHKVNLRVTIWPFFNCIKKLIC